MPTIRSIARKLSASTQKNFACTEIDGVETGSKVTLIGEDGNEVITADDMAESIGTIGYEIVCNISRRVEREYTWGF